MSLTVSQRVSSAADAVIAAGNKAELKVTGTLVAAATGIVTVPVGTVGGAALGALGRGGTGYLDAYRREPRLASSPFNLDKTALIAGAGGGVGLAVGLGAMALGADVSLLEAVGAGIGGIGIGYLAPGVINGVAACFVGGKDGAVKGFKTGVAAAEVVGGGAQYVTDESIKLARKLCKDAVHVAEVAGHNVVEAGRETIEGVRRIEANALQCAADIAKERANAVSPEGAFDKNGKELPNKPAQFKEFD